jgi:hypothetical protein
MKYKWSFFFAAAWLATYYLVSRGVPVVPVIAGVGLAAVTTWRKLSKNRAPAAQQNSTA